MNLIEDKIEEFFNNYGLEVKEIRDKMDRDGCYVVYIANTQLEFYVYMHDDNRYFMSIYDESDGNVISNNDYKYSDSLELAFDHVMDAVMEDYADIINLYKLYSK